MSKITICDVGPRDGLQNEDKVLAPETRAELVTRLVDAGLQRVEAVSFVSPKWVPQMAQAEEVLERVGRPEATIAGLVLNERGYERASATPVGEVHFAFAVTETFNGRNSNSSVEDSMAVAERVTRLARADGKRATVTLAAAFGCPFEGDVDAGHVLELARRVSEFGVDEIVFADTIGVGSPGQVRALVEPSLSFGPAVGLHLHNTRSTGYANAYVGIEAGASILDTSIGGLGGCPFAPRATGNIATEDLVYMLERDGIETGIDLDALIGVASWMEEVLGRELPGQVYRAGLAPRGTTTVA